MTFLPYEHYTIKTSLSTDDIITRLKEGLDEWKSMRWFWSKNTHPYEGAVDGMTFRMRRIIRYRNSFLPTVSGSITQRHGVSLVEIRMKMHPIAIAFVCMWFGFIVNFLIAAIASADTSLLSLKKANPALLIPLAMLIFGYLLMMGGFKFESRKAKRYCAEFFKGPYDSGFMKTSNA